MRTLILDTDLTYFLPYNLYFQWFQDRTRDLERSIVAHVHNQDPPNRESSLSRATKISLLYSVLKVVRSETVVPPFCNSCSSTSPSPAASIG
ncbi:hypothetical protein NPIL_6091 [Nephila pilipes]|uniref:Uncharacterized protein n=1 Tax=Nephila pilipes TaxID=299642 RepID=A0A8X6TPS4_NEPPI|nr:hypothetical protein NPIL_6091 [Nephila pilipes]